MNPYYSFNHNSPVTVVRNISPPARKPTPVSRPRSRTPENSPNTTEATQSSTPTKQNARKTTQSIPQKTQSTPQKTQSAPQTSQKGTKTAQGATPTKQSAKSTTQGTLQAKQSAPKPTQSVPQTIQSIPQSEQTTAQKTVSFPTPQTQPNKNQPPPLSLEKGADASVNTTTTQPLSVNTVTQQPINAEPSIDMHTALADSVHNLSRRPQSPLSSTSVASEHREFELGNSYLPPLISSTSSRLAVNVTPPLPPRGTGVFYIERDIYRYIYIYI